MSFPPTTTSLKRSYDSLVDYDEEHEASDAQTTEMQLDGEAMKSKSSVVRRRQVESLRKRRNGITMRFALWRSPRKKLTTPLPNLPMQH
jgi:hypothetical protein